jgi:RNA polymerase sigma factor (sigma-70 family)
VPGSNLYVTAAEKASVVAIEAVYRQRFHRFVQVAEAVCGDPGLARDAVQNAFAAAIRTRSEFRGEARLESWLWGCVLNAARKTRRDRLEGLTGVDEERAATNGHAVESSSLRQALAGLPERQRQVLFLRHFADLDYASIAEALGISTGTVGATLNQAHSALRRLLEETSL